MIYDMRTYDIEPGKIPDFMAAVREVALPVRLAHGIKLGGWYYAEIGTLNQVTHIWAYRDTDHWRQARPLVQSDPRWVSDYAPRIRGLVQAQRDQLMHAADFAPAPADVARPPSTPMVYDMRTYDLKPGTVPEYMAAVREVALPVEQAAGVKLAGWFYGEIGPLNQVVHIWAYPSFGDIPRKRQEFANDPRWFNEYVPRVKDLLVAQRDQLMHGADFFPGPP